MKLRAVLSCLLVVSGIAVISYSSTRYLQQLLMSKPIHKDHKQRIEQVKEEKTEIPWVRYASGERPKEGEQFAFLIIPRLDIQLPILEGTTKESLVQGVGHYKGSVLPGEPDNAVLSAHRDTHFRNLGLLKEGDKLGIKTSKGIFVYEVKKYWVTSSDDRSVIVPHKEPVLTMTTCYPFKYMGLAPKRYVVQSVLKRKIDL